jgi:RNA polymerase sigma-70 factor (ECF subfamily)
MPEKAVFPTTQWSEIVTARQTDTEAGRAALEQVLVRYYPALQAHLWCKHGRADADAEDCLQAFILDKVMRGGILSQADRRRGRFRTFLLNALDNYARNRWRDAQTQRRMPAGGLVAYEDLDGFDPPAELEDRPAVSDAAWAVATFQAAAQGMEAECRAKGRLDVWEIFAGRFLRPYLDDEPHQPYATLVQRLNLQSPSQAANLFITGKRMFERILWEVVGESEFSREVVGEEIAELKAILLAARRRGGLPAG